MQFQEFILDIDEDNHQIFMEKDVAILNFFSDWHMGCLMTLPIIENLAEEFFGKAFFGKVNVEEAEEIARRFEVHKVPTTLIFRKGHIVERIENHDSEEVLRERICCFL